MRITKQVVFGDSDLELLDYIDNNGYKFSSYVKELIRQDMSCSDVAGAVDLAPVEAKLERLISMLETGATVRQEVVAEQEPVVNTEQKSRILGIMGQFGM